MAVISENSKEIMDIVLPLAEDMAATKKPRTKKKKLSEEEITLQGIAEKLQKLEPGFKKHLDIYLSRLQITFGLYLKNQVQPSPELILSWLLTDELYLQDFVGWNMLHEWMLGITVIEAVFVTNSEFLEFEPLSKDEIIEAFSKVQ